MALFSRTAATRFQLALWERWPAWCTKLATILKFVDCAVWCPGMSLGSGILRMRQQASGAACRQWLHCDAGPMMQPTLTWKNAVAAFDCFQLFGQLHKLGCFCSVHLRTWRSEVRMHVLRWQSGKTLRWCTRWQGDCGIKTCPSCPSSSLVGSFRCTQRNPEGPGQIHAGPMPGLWCSLHWLGRVL